MKFFIPHELGQIIIHLTKSIPEEYTLFGKTKIEGELVTLVDIRVPNQESTHGDTEVSPDNMEKFMMELLDSGENPKDWNMWIHSHNTMGAFWSGTDTSQMQSFNSGGPDFFFHMVVSTQGSRAACTMYKPFNMMMDEVAIEWEKVPPEVDPRVDIIQAKINKLQLELTAITSVLPEKVTETLQEVMAKNVIKKFQTPNLPYNENSNDRVSDPQHFGYKNWYDMFGSNYAEDKSYLLASNDEFWYNEWDRLFRIAGHHKEKCKCKSCECLVLSMHAVDYLSQKEYNYAG